jgi:hypothetical protein
MTVLLRRLVVLLALAAAAIAAGAGATAASAHPMNTSAVLLDIHSDRVTAEVRLPLDRLAVALGRTELTAAPAGGTLRSSLQTYTRDRITATAKDGTAWTVAVAPGTVKTFNGIRYLVEDVTLTPPAGGSVTGFSLGYDVILDTLVTHQAIVTIRSQWKEGTNAANAQTLGVFDWDTHTLTVDAAGGSWWRGMLTTGALGVHHISSGADHLLFLMMLLIPAPLVAVRGRWRRTDDTRRSVGRTVHVVTAFAIGHSITLALAALGVIHAPAQVVEALIALSILVSAIHALRPLVPGGEPAIALGFGLVHGLAFATLIGDLGLDRGSLVSSLLAFNLGIEVTQLLVLALIMPSLLILSRTPVYGRFRVVVASLGIVLSGAWLLDRVGVIATDPLDPITNALVGHPLLVAAVLALGAAFAHYGTAGRAEVPATAAARTAP